MAGWSKSKAPHADFPELPHGELFSLGHYKIRRIVQKPKVSVNDRLPCLMIHGFAANAISFRELQPALSAYSETHNLDLPGMGYSDRPPDEYTLAFYEKFILNYMDKEGIEKCDLVGHSLGGTIAILFALNYPSRVRRLVLISPLINFLRIQSGLLGKGLKAISTPYLAPSLISLKGKWFAKLFLEKIMAEHHALDGELIDDYYEPHRRKDSSQAMYKINRMLADPENQLIMKRLANLAVPCLVLWGGNDPLLPVEDAEHLKRDIKDVQIAIIAGAGHMLMHERYREVNQSILKFLFE